MTPPARIYFDNAATSWPKPETVYAAVEKYQRVCGAPAGRSAYREASEAQKIVENCRAAVARLIGAEERRRIAFALNGTDALNMALHGILQAGDHVVTTTVEHNSVLRPLRTLETTSGVSVTRVPCNAQGVIDADAFLAAIKPETRLAAVIHASNVTGAIQPVEAIAQGLKTLKHQETLLLVDAAQSLGHLPIDVQELGCDLLAAPGHKGLLGPLGTGLLYVGPLAEERLHSTRQGGTGTRSDQDTQPWELPERLESGNHNLPGLAGLLAGVKYVEERTVAEIGRQGAELRRQLWEGLNQVSGVTLFGPADAGACVPVVSFTLEGYDPQEVAAMLDASARVQVRAGFHCAPLVHQALGTSAQGGTVRMSFGLFNTAAEVDAAVAAVRMLAGQGLGTGVGKG